MGIDLGYGYRVSQIILKPTSPDHRVDIENLEVFASLYNNENSWGDPVAVTVEKATAAGENYQVGDILITFDPVKFARYIKIHSHFYEMDADGNAVTAKSNFQLNPTAPYSVTLMSNGRNEFYKYDSKGNREKVSFYATELITHAYTYYPGSNLIKTVTSATKTTGYTYDANGNMIEKGNNFTEPAGVITYTKDNTYRRYEYDLLNRLVGVYSWDTEANGGTGAERLEKSYIYNAQGLRIEAIRNGLSTIYTFDQQGQMAQRDQEVTDNNFETRNYHYLGSKIIAHTDDPNTAQEETLYYGTDHLGSTTLITDAAGAEVWSGSVTPFADQESASDTSERVLFTGKELDQDTDLYYFNARWYDPELGRFTTEDPIRDGANWFIYVNNNPLRFVDPSGLEYMAVTASGYQQKGKGEIPRAGPLSKYGCKVQTFTNIVNTLRRDSTPFSIDDVNKYAADNSLYDEDGNISNENAIKLVEALSGYKLTLVNQAEGKADILKQAQTNDASGSKYFGVLVTDFTTEDDKNHFLNVTGATEEDLNLTDSSSRKRTGLSQLRTDVKEQPSRLDTFSFTFTGNRARDFEPGMGTVTDEEEGDMK